MGHHKPEPVSPASPARAGMDRSLPSTPGRTGCFPRTGGDGPTLEYEMVYDHALPPHGRGWTGAGLLLRSYACASPARAGMDRPGSNGSRPRPGFPRTGGDGPIALPRWIGRGSLPPHGRGWTSRKVRAALRHFASPARGGDGPSITPYRACAIRLPPHGRGWTPYSPSRRPKPRASPARAGMDRRYGRGAARSPGFPRTGGDGPSVNANIHGKQWLPPYGRGWTGRLVCCSRNSRASPARAGMDLVHPDTKAPACSFPRTGGGWTGNRKPWYVSGLASPARAGMDRYTARLTSGPSGFPRTGGDGPPGETYGHITLQLPPHGRGWTYIGSGPYQVGCASPARAGMDRR